jgi:hypothetical protein
MLSAGWKCLGLKINLFLYWVAQIKFILNNLHDRRRGFH